MKRAFIVNADGRLSSALVSIDTPNALNIGDRITISRPLDLGHEAEIEKGEQGTVDHIDASTGFTNILMDRLHWGLAPWRNHMWLEPYGTEDIEDGLVLHFCDRHGEALKVCTAASATIRAIA